MNNSSVKEGSGKYVDMVKPRKAVYFGASCEKQEVLRMAALKRQIRRFNAAMEQEPVKVKRQRSARSVGSWASEEDSEEAADDGQRRIAFEYTKATEYTRHQPTEVILGLFLNTNVDAFVSYSKSNLHVWSARCGAQLVATSLLDVTGSETINAAAYSRSLRLYFVASSDFKIHLFNEYFVYVGWFPLNIRLV